MDKIKLALLGLGSRTTAFYVSELNRVFNQKHGGYSTCPFILWNANFDVINSLLPSISAKLNAIVQDYIRQVENLEIEHILIPNITLHESIDQIELKKNILHPIHLTLSKIKEKKLHKIVLMGSEYTMNSAYIPSILNSNRIEVEIPAEEDRLQIDEFRRQVYVQKESKEQIENYHTIIKRYTTKNLVVLACTELSIFKPQDNTNLFDMAQIQIAAAIDKL